MIRYAGIAGSAFFLSLTSCLVLLFSFMDILFRLDNLTASLIFISALAGFNFGFVALVKNSEHSRKFWVMTLSLFAVMLGAIPYLSLLANAG